MGKKTKTRTSSTQETGPRGSAAALGHAELRLGLAARSVDHGWKTQETRLVSRGMLG